MNTRLTKISRIVCLIAAIVLAYIISLPIWRIELTAPQYPEGLVLKIFASKLSGDVDVINGLNHYIGMRTLHTSDFIEFTVLPYIIGCLAFFGLLTALINRKWFFYTWIGSLLLFGAVALVDFYRWNYNYGHNLNPEAPIRVPGMSYQPPLIGYKQLLNFGAYSIPDIGGWIFIGVYVMLFVIMFIELKRTIRARQAIPTTFVISSMFLFLSSCSTSPRVLKPGTDACDFCKMTVTDPKFGSELITSTGKLYVFDDLHCLQGYASSNKDRLHKAAYYVVDFQNGAMVPAGDAILVHSDAVHSPMGSNTITFANSSDANQFIKSNGGNEVSWNSIIPQ